MPFASMLVVAAVAQLYPVMVGGKTGFFDVQGKMVIAPQFRDGLPFTEGLGAVKRKDGWAFITSAGAVAIAGPFYEVRPFSEGFAAVATARDQWTFIDTKGAVQGPSVFRELFDVKGGLALASRAVAPPGPEPSYLLVTPKGQLGVPPKLEGCARFVAPFRHLEHLRQAGGPALLLRCGRDSESFSRSQGDVPDTWGYYAPDSKRWLVPPTLGLSYPFTEGLAFARRGADYELLDATGRAVSPQRYASVVAPFLGGVAVVKRKDAAGWREVVIGADGAERWALPEGATFAARVGTAVLATKNEPGQAIVVLFSTAGRELGRWPNVIVARFERDMVQLVDTRASQTMFVDPQGRVVFQQKL